MSLLLSLTFHLVCNTPPEAIGCDGLRIPTFFADAPHHCVHRHSSPDLRWGSLAIRQELAEYGEVFLLWLDLKLSRTGRGRETTAVKAFWSYFIHKDIVC